LTSGQHAPDCRPDTVGHFCRGSLARNTNDPLRLGGSQRLEALVDAAVKLQVLLFELIGKPGSR
jgi:hypothetical protein